MHICFVNVKFLKALICQKRLVLMVGLKNYESELFKILGKLSQMCLKESRPLEGLMCGPCI